MPEKTAAQKKAQQKYMEKFVRVEIRMEAEKRTAIQAHAEAQSESVNGFINRAIDQTMGQDRDKGSSEPRRGPLGSETVYLPSEAYKCAVDASEGAGEELSDFVARAVVTQAQRDKASLAMGINPTTGGKLEKEA